MYFISCGNNIGCAVSFPLHDLNLLRVLLAVHSTRSVSKAAQQLFMTQSAISNALRRLRAQLNDQLFVRSKAGMQPTALVESIVGPIETSLRSIEEAVHAHQRFQPARSERLFRFLSNDLAQMFFIPPLISHLSRVAPLIRLETVDTSWEDGRRALHEGQLDLAIGNWLPMGVGYHSVELFREHFVVLMSRKHALARRGLTRAAYVEARHVDYRPGGESYRVLRGALDEVLARGGQARRIAFTAGHGLGLAAIIANSDLLLTLPSRLAAAMTSDRRSLVVQPLPYESPSVVVSMQWHSRSSQDPALVWFRQQLVDLFVDGSV